MKILIFLVSLIGSIVYIAIVSCSNNTTEIGDYNFVFGTDYCGITNYNLMIGGALGLLIFVLFTTYIKYQIKLIKNKS